MLSRRTVARAALSVTVLATVLATALTTPARAATARPAVPESVRAIITAMGLEKVADLSYRDAAGKLITAEQFAQLLKQGQPFTATKTARPGEPMKATLSISTPEALRAMAPPPPKLKAGEQFPPFRLARLDGAAFDNASLRGRYSIINFYFALCAPCVQEVPELNALAKNRGDINVVGITFDTALETRQFAADKKFAWTLLPDAKILIDQLGVRAYPSFALLDPAGRVVAIDVHDAILKKDKSIAAWVERLAPVVK